jgi:hypothetical protein
MNHKIWFITYDRPEMLVYEYLWLSKFIFNTSHNNVLPRKMFKHSGSRSNPDPARSRPKLKFPILIPPGPDLSRNFQSRSRFRTLMDMSVLDKYWTRIKLDRLIPDSLKSYSSVRALCFLRSNRLRITWYEKIKVKICNKNYQLTVEYECKFIFWTYSSLIYACSIDDTLS